MTTWRLEILRLVRTRRWLGLLVIYLFFGLTSPLIVRYQAEIVEMMGQGLAVTGPPPTPSDGIGSYVGNASQLGVLAVIIVSALAMAVHTRPEIAIFLRSRVSHAWQLVLPALIVNAAAACVAYTIGTLAAVYETSVLLGPLDLGGLAAGWLFGIAYHCFVVTVVAVLACSARGYLAPIAGAVAVLLVLAGVGSVLDRKVLPTALMSAMTDLAGGGRVAEYVPAAAAAAVVAAGCVVVSVRLVTRREL